MTKNMQMEQLSLAYIRAVAANSGYQVVRPEPDVDSVDGVLMAAFGKRPRIEFQAKATTQDIFRGDELRFPLPVKNYNELRADTRVPRILLVFLMPEEESHWLLQTNDELCLRRCAYWLSLESLPGTPNTDTVTVRVPVRNVFDSNKLVDLMQQAERGETLC